ncbi:2-keto-3-deoxygluconate permease [Bariatricus massiliensis]|uniref:2-keto-3-deoxygluconate permease n=1 Tax=Bariatricus massiliensis TaxID=1745713 RepID=A0ABS8DJ89_9FIRM|nr:2-keto-3-deoxygluconate permease [Bariatricus massiliensis]MCB7305307.1 2-keto-3-deoxygluconate permease [Bariatricus massiliensis]MCB7375800.1 2-keto-3-deoxygluconate permease [Bariatricus massiliensis]MCB7388450.1 2-keto-3-deoxygluconate permease [Bariatricus massiliensis]MCB7412562.1 2-keto-3-deoxygluconate permease [Bariatricus massiliensis]MCQ5254800.1 2-keto-3-deoxygluconate permease [Bariatricus massiliensis]
MILNFLKKIPAGMMVVPLLLGSIITTIFPNIWEIGGLTAAVFSSVGTNTLLGAQLFCMGTALQVKDMPAVLKRGGVLLIAKFAIGAGLGILVGKLFGDAGFFGLSTLAIVSAVTNSNGSVYLTLMGNYGDRADAGCFPLLALNDGPFFTLVALGASGLANIPFMSLLAAIIPVALGMLIGNLDHGMRDIFAPMGTAIIPLIGFALGTGINLMNIVKGGASGIILGLITVFIGGIFIVLCDRFISRRPGYAGWAVATTAGNAVAVPAAVALVDPSLEAVAATATVQVAASVVVSCILVPIITSWWAKKYGCPQMPLEGQEFK